MSLTLYASHALDKTQSLLATLRTIVQRARFGLLSHASAKLRQELTDIVHAAVDATGKADNRYWAAIDEAHASRDAAHANIQQWSKQERSRVTQHLSKINEHLNTESI
ncbi:hypothetical protein HOR51_gp14 [Ralstonia phage phiAp1]|uniref:Uncharacterized protein n=1 Tax=Ralstonia phage phiAp1 TaxID=2783867 RepID=A0A1L7DS95_9CAUD|nr:hypothetical protein HOR51_gp14 [Ralstonia phage phiAp1]APU03155.1 hypothetical protein phiAp1_14 [Ralstonia phage phiAp1]